MYNRALSKAYTWLATRLYVLADRIMRQAAEGDDANRKDADTVAGKTLSGSPPAHWLDLVRRHAPELYRSVQVRHGYTASPANPTGTGHVDKTLDVQDVSADANRAVQTAVRSDVAVTQQGTYGIRPASQGVVSGSPASERDTNISTAGHTSVTLQTGHAKLPSQPRPILPRQPEETAPAQPCYGHAGPAPASRVHDPEPPCTTSAPSIRVAQLPNESVAPQPVTSYVADSGVQQPAIEPAPTPTMHDDNNIAASPVNPGSDSVVPGLAIEPTCAPATPAHMVLSKAGLHLFTAPGQTEAEYLYPQAVKRWPSLPDPVQETNTGPDGHWASLPDDSWTLPLHPGVPGGLRVTGETHGTNRDRFDEWPGESWKE